ncbi:MAG: hypothetical protein J0M11_10145 [Anaerolineae bacterium]|nr:hypothetical protein [Anaerolineae bacterium]
MNPWADGLSALTGHAWAVCAVFVVIVWGFFIIRGILLRFFNSSLTEADVISISLAGWVVPILFLSIFTFGIALLFNAFIAGILAVLIIIVSSLILIRTNAIRFSILIFVILLIPSFILRFAFISNLVLPSYFDPAEHYRLIYLLTESYRTGTFAVELMQAFYHLGFHSAIAFISFYLQIEIIDLMLVFGPLVLALLPFPFYFLIKRETGSAAAAFFACLLAGFGFHMPAHLMNWGKYPALLGFVAMLFVFQLMYMLYRKFENRKQLIILLSFAVLASGLIHSRTLIVFGLMCLAALITLAWTHQKILFRRVSFVSLIIAFVIEIVALQNNPALQTLLSSYINNDSLILFFILLLSVASAFAYPRQTFFLFAWLILSILCLFIPIPIPIHGIQTPLDRPFVQMFAIIPFSLLGGLGLAGVTQWMERLRPNCGLIQRFLYFFVFGVVLLNSALHYRFYPSECCRFASRDDLAAFTWMDENLPPDATILIASTGLYVTSFETPEKQTGVDAGIWIAPLLSRTVKLAGSEIQFDQADTHTDLCKQEVQYIYIGGMPQSFDAGQLDGIPAWYAPTFALPSAKIYQVLCKGQ